MHTHQSLLSALTQATAELSSQGIKVDQLTGLLQSLVQQQAELQQTLAEQSQTIHQLAAQIQSLRPHEHPGE